METTFSPQISTGIAGLDKVLGGGIPSGHIYPVQGRPGTGKTTIALHFLREGVSQGEKVLYITLAQTEDELKGIAASHGMGLEDITVADLSPSAQEGEDRSAQTVVQTRAVELEHTMQAVEDVVAREEPDRVVLDSLVEIQLLSGSENDYRREFLNLKQRFLSRGCTVLLLDTWSEQREGEAIRIEALVHGVIRLDWRLPDYGIAHRRIAVSKLRGHPFVEGFHDMSIETGGAVVYPRLNIDRSKAQDDPRTISTGIANLDELCGGGFALGTTCLIAGNAGTGKSTLSTAYLREAARKGENVAIFLFEERVPLFLQRARALSLDLQADDLTGRVDLFSFDPAEVTPGQLFANVQEQVEAGANVVLIDSLTGFLKALPPHDEVMLHFHPLLSYLSRQNVLTLLVLDLRGGMGPTLNPEVDLSFLADSILVLRQYQSGSDIRRSIAVMKKRYGPHLTELRELRITEEGLKVEPIAEGVDLSRLHYLSAY